MRRSLTDPRERVFILTPDFRTWRNESPVGPATVQGSTFGLPRGYA